MAPAKASDSFPYGAPAWSGQGRRPHANAGDGQEQRHDDETHQRDRERHLDERDALVGIAACQSVTSAAVRWALVRDRHLVHLNGSGSAVAAPTERSLEPPRTARAASVNCAKCTPGKVSRPLRVKQEIVKMSGRRAALCQAAARSRMVGGISVARRPSSAVGVDGLLPPLFFVRSMVDLDRAIRHDRGGGATRATRRRVARVRRSCGRGRVCYLSSPGMMSSTLSDTES